MVADLKLRAKGEARQSWQVQHVQLLQGRNRWRESHASCVLGHFSNQKSVLKRFLHFFLESSNGMFNIKKTRMLIYVHIYILL